MTDPEKMNVQQLSTSTADHLEKLLVEAEFAAEELGFKGIADAKKSIQANRKEIIVYFDHEAEDSCLSIRMVCKVGGEFKFDYFTTIEMCHEPTTNLKAAIKEWNKFSK